jgi:hypothetical protein
MNDGASGEFQQVPRVDFFENIAEFLATGMGGEDYCYLNFSSFLDKRVLLTGFHGDWVWGMVKQPNDLLIQGDMSGCSLQEFRLQRNFIHIPVPLIGARRNAEIFAISQMEEMYAYRLYNDYDRPICRRMLEESGVARELFGQKKNAASNLFFLNPGSLPLPDSSILEEIACSTFTHVKVKLLGKIWGFRYRLFVLARDAGRKFTLISGLEKIFVSELRIFEHQHPKSVLDFLHGLAWTRRRYRAGLSKRSDC